jgi:hypothetical protein
MDLKTFKQGVEFLARATNQREKEPAPFLVQVGKDGRLSLVAGEGTRAYIWRTDVYQHALGHREGVSSKLLVQTTKTLKGKDLTVDLVFDPNMNQLRVQTSKGGVVKMPFIDAPDIRPPRQGDGEGYLELPEGRLAELVGAFNAVSDGDLTRGVQFLGKDGKVTLVSTEEHKAFVTYIDAEIDSRWSNYKWGTTTDFWNPLRQIQSAATLTFSQSGLHVRAGEFEAYTGFSIRPVYDIRETYYPAGQRPPIYVVTDRKVLLGSIKAVTEDDKSKTIDMSQTAEGGFFLSSGKQHVGMPRAKGKGWGRVGFSPEYMSDILNAMSGREVILAWHEDGTKPIGIKDTTRQGDSFLLAPRAGI